MAIIKKGCMLMKKYVAMILGILFISLCACKSSSNEVVFVNYIPSMDEEPVTIPYNLLNWSYPTNQPQDTLYAVFLEHETGEYDEEYVELVDSFEWNEEESEEINNARFADYLIALYDYETKMAIEMIKDTNLILLEDYPYCFYNHSQENLVLNRPWEHLILGNCAVVGTYEELKKVFDGTEPVNGHCFKVWAAPRPDMVEKAQEAGYKDSMESGWIGEWMLKNRGSVKKVIGKGFYVTMKVDFETVED